MTLHFEENKGILYVMLQGEIDHHVASTISKYIDKRVLETRCKKVSLNFSHVTFMDSSGIGMVIGRSKLIGKKGGEMKIEGCNTYVKHILEMAGIFTLIPYGEWDFEKKEGRPN